MGTSGLGSLLVEEGLLTENDRRTIRRSSGMHGSAFARSIVAMGLMDEDELATFLAERTRFRVAGKDLMRDSDKSALAAIDPPLLERLEVLPLRVTDDTLMVAMADPLDMDTVRQLEFFTGLKVQPVIATFSQIRTCLEKTIKNYRPLSGQLEDFLTNHAVSATRRQKLGSPTKGGGVAHVPIPMAAPPTAAPAANPSSRAHGAAGFAAVRGEEPDSFSSRDALDDDDAPSPAISDDGAATALEDIDSLDDLGGDDLADEEPPRAGGPDPASLGDFDEEEAAAPTAGSSAARAAPVEDLGDFDINGNLDVEGDIDNLFGDESGGGDPFAESDAAASAAAEGTSGDELGGLEGGGDELAGLDGELEGGDELGGLEGGGGADELGSSDDLAGLDGDASSDGGPAATSDDDLLDGGDDLAGGDLADDLLTADGGGEPAVSAGADDELSFGDDLGLEDDAPAKPAAAAKPAPAAKPAAASKPAPAAKAARKTEELDSLSFDDDPLGASQGGSDDGMPGSVDAALTEGDDAFSGDGSADDAFAAGDDLMPSDDPLSASDDAPMSADDTFGSGDEDLLGAGSGGSPDEVLAADELDGADLSATDSSPLAASEDPFGDDELSGDDGEPVIGALSEDNVPDGPAVGDLVGAAMAADDDLSAFGIDDEPTPTPMASSTPKPAAAAAAPAAKPAPVSKPVATPKPAAKPAAKPSATDELDFAADLDELGDLDGLDATGGTDDELAALGDAAAVDGTSAPDEDELAGLGDELAEGAAGVDIPESSDADAALALGDDALAGFDDDPQEKPAIARNDELAMADDLTGGPAGAGDDELESLGGDLTEAHGAATDDELEDLGDDLSASSAIAAGNDELEGLGDDLSASPAAEGEDELEGLGDDLSASPAAAGDDELEGLGDDFSAEPAGGDDELESLDDDRTESSLSATGDDGSSAAFGNDPLAEALGDLKPQPEAFAVATNRALVAMSLAVGSQEAARLAAPALVATGFIRGVLIAFPSKGDPRPFCAWRRTGADTTVDLKGLEPYAAPDLAAALKRVSDTWVEVEDLARSLDLKPIQEWKKDGGAKLLACMLKSASGARLAAIVAIEPKAAADPAKKDGAMTVLRSLAKAC